MSGEGDSNEPQGIVDGGKGGGDEVVDVNVWYSNGMKFVVVTSLKSTVKSFKALLEQNCDVLAYPQRLIYSGQILHND